MPTVTRDNVTISYEVRGEGPPLVLTHSFLCAGDMWRYQLPLLADRCRTLNIDLRGHGDSSKLSEPYSIYDLVDDVVAVLDQEGVERAIWCGLSIGGMVSLRAALRVPSRVSALVLCDTDAGTEQPLVCLKYGAMGIVARFVGPKPLAGAILPIFFGPRTRREQHDLVAEYRQRLAHLDVPSTLAGLPALTGRDDLRGGLGTITVPTLVVVGEDDAALPISCSRTIADGIPEAELEIIPAAGHLAPLEQPGLFNRALLRFLDNLLEGAPAS